MVVERLRVRHSRVVVGVAGEGHQLELLGVASVLVVARGIVELALHGHGFGCWKGKRVGGDSGPMQRWQV